MRKDLKFVLNTFLFCFLSLSLLEASASSQKMPKDGSCVYVDPVWDYVDSFWEGGLKQSGSMGGALIGYSYLERDSWYFAAEFTYMAGILKGSAGNDPTQEYITELRFGYNLSAPFADRFTITPFLGAASYVFNQSLSGSPNFKSHFWYVPIGVAFDFRINDQWTIGFMGMGAPSFGGKWKVVYQGNAPTSALWRAELPLIYLGANPFNFSFIPFAKGWSYHANGGLSEQKNVYYGIEASFGYFF